MLLILKKSDIMIAFNKKGEYSMADFTKKAISMSIMRLLDEKPLKQITVKDIVDDCGINRNTF